MIRSLAISAFALVVTVGAANAACDPTTAMMEISTASATKLMSLPADKQAAVSKALETATNAMATGKNDDACKAIDVAKDLLK